MADHNFVRAIPQPPQALRQPLPSFATLMSLPHQAHHPPTTPRLRHNNPLPPSPPPRNGRRSRPRRRPLPRHALPLELAFHPRPHRRHPLPERAGGDQGLRGAGHLLPARGSGHRRAALWSPRFRSGGTTGRCSPCIRIQRCGPHAAAAGRPDRAAGPARAGRDAGAVLCVSRVHQRPGAGGAGAARGERVPRVEVGEARERVSQAGGLGGRAGHGAGGGGVECWEGFGFVDGRRRGGEVEGCEGWGQEVWLFGAGVGGGRGLMGEGGLW